MASSEALKKIREDGIGVHRADAIQVRNALAVETDSIEPPRKVLLPVGARDSMRRSYKSVHTACAFSS
ncbi:MAG: hypothetical protein H0U64_02270 [Gemmatimonadaceae bacterium]|nr:hypothetical protein [Gemmatimonadaceae bacterium]MBA3645884.1 hypothetical protein [Gemmatimonadaceae bacterium]